MTKRNRSILKRHASNASVCSAGKKGYMQLSTLMNSLLTTPEMRSILGALGSASSDFSDLVAGSTISLCDQCALPLMWVKSADSKPIALLWIGGELSTNLSGLDSEPILKLLQKNTESKRSIPTPRRKSPSCYSLKAIGFRFQKKLVSRGPRSACSTSWRKHR